MRVFNAPYRILALASAASVFTLTAAAQVDTVLPEDDESAPEAERVSPEGASYPDGEGGEVYFPIGEASFADTVTEFVPGQPDATRVSARTPSGALGAPDYDENADTGYVTLGCGGVLIAQFDDNVIVNVDGPDLYVYEIGETEEPMRLSISTDGEEFVDIGEIGGGVTGVELEDHIENTEAYRYVRLQDAGEACEPSWPGADIDAIGAIGSGQRLLLESAVLFDFNEATLREEAVDALRSVNAAIEEQDSARVIIEGYTDASGDANYNMDLSRRRADAVRARLEEISDRDQDTFVSVGRGETRPVAPNDSSQGAAQNRRVEILILTP